MRPITSVLVLSLFASPGVLGCERTGGDDSARPDPARPGPAPLAELRDPGGPSIQHTLRFPDPQTHYLEVESIFPTGGEDELLLSMAVWTPGSYLVREFARHVEGFAATAPDGALLSSTKVSKNRWRVEVAGVERVVVRYRLYARELSVRANFVDDTIAILNGAPTFLAPIEGERRAQDVSLVLPAGWERSVTGLPPHPDGGAHRYLAADYDELVDAPIVAGTPLLSTFEVEGVEHTLATFGNLDRFDQERAARDLQSLVEAARAFWGELPYDRYVFFNLLYEPGGGLEHGSSALTMSDPFVAGTRERWESWLGLMAHELFHAWNGKRLRPVELGPFDYENEVHTTGLWVVEGLSSYYDDQLLLRASLIDGETYFERLSKNIEAVQTRPGRRVQPLSQSSFDAWIKFYRPDENSDNSSVSYYAKGAVVGFLLDARIRDATNGARSLDDVMREAYARYSGERGFTQEELRGLFDDVAGTPMGDLLAETVDGTTELDYAPALELYGLRFGDLEDEEEPAGWLGATVGTGRRSNVVTGVPRDTVAETAGLSVDDEIIALGELRVPPGGLEALLEGYRPGEEVSILISRRGRLRRIPVALGAEPRESWSLEELEQPTSVQRGHLTSWLPSPP